MRGSGLGGAMKRLGADDGEQTCENAPFVRPSLMHHLSSFCLHGYRRRHWYRHGRTMAMIAARC